MGNCCESSNRSDEEIGQYDPAKVLRQELQAQQQEARVGITLLDLQGSVNEVGESALDRELEQARMLFDQYQA